jgi:hypothetical protein
MALEEKIAQTQEKIRADIVIVILNESLEARYPDLIYSRVDETGAYEGIRRYAESYWVENGFGWNEPGNTGNGIIMVDNVYRESNGWVYNWVAGAGDMRFSVGDSTCEKLSQAFTDRLRYGDLPPYTQLYADALMEFVSDCGSFGYSVRGMLGWQLFTPRVMFAVITSSLVKAAMFGADANWGRVLCAIGYSGAKVDVTGVEVAFRSAAGMVRVCEHGAGIPFSEEEAKAVLLEKEIEILIQLQDGNADAVAWGCDLTYDYVRINGDYRT